MAISDEKRREIAASLRESREFISGLPKASLEQNAFDTFERILACVDYERGNIFDYLADLIDRPTCERVECDQHYWRCSRCGVFVYWDAVANLTGVVPTRYCPNCGAEVVNDD